MCRINPKVDLVFKKLFGSEENKDILQSLINALLPREERISQLELKNPYNLADYIAGKLSILDIKAVDEKGKWYDIEMQVDPLGYYGQKALFYWGKVFTAQIDSGELYSQLNKTIVISILDFIYFPGDERHHRIVSLRDIESFEKYAGLDFMDLHFVELKKFKKELNEIKTTLDRWATFLNHAYKYEKDKIPPELAEDKEVKKAIEKLDVMYLNEKEREYYEAEQKAIRDKAEALRTAEEKGREKGEKIGIEKGEKIGIEKGEKIGIEKAALNMINHGMTMDDVIKITGLSSDVIKKITKTNTNDH
jgi:predicted transposase/invertase (TIGR01784 family)